MKRRVLSLNLVSILLCLASLTASAAVIQVTPDSAGIQAAIESAADGDQIIVLPGVYQEHINFLGKAITVRSTDPDDWDVVAATIIDGTNTGRCVTFENDEGPESVLAGLTITNGNANSEAWGGRGGGIYCQSSSPTITGNIIMANTAAYRGGGLYCGDASPSIVANLITANTAEHQGGGICVYSGSPLINGNTISGNRATHGGGISGYSSGGFQITNNIITGNEASFNGGGIYNEANSFVAFNSITANRASHGGGIYCRSGNPVFAENLIADNIATFGGGIRAIDSSPILCANLISGNHTDSVGGGISATYSSLILYANLITGNRADKHGAGVNFSSSIVFMAGDVIAGNTADIAGGGGVDTNTCSVSMTNVVITQNYAMYGAAIHCNSSTLRILNSIIWHNYWTKWVVFDQTKESSSQAESYGTPSLNGITADPPLPPGTRLTLGNSVISSVLGPIDFGHTANVIVEFDNINADPIFMDPGHWDDNGTPDDYDDDFFVMGDYHLLRGSPCIDAGINNIDDPDTEAVEEMPETDFDGVPRILDGDADGTAIVDIGAYEYVGGDVNGDRLVNVLDIILVRNNLGKDPSSDPAARRADVNNDGKVDIMDFIAVRNLLSAW